MNIELFSFNKRKNSTKAPTGSGTQVSVVLKEETSSMKPGFELTSSNLPANVTYVKAFGNWYYISDITLQTNTKWLISCVLDPLASFAAAIKNTTAFIEYADTYNSRIYDPRLAKLINATEISETASGTYINTSGYFVVASVGDNGSGTVILSSYNQVEQLGNEISNFLSQLTWASGDIVNAIKNFVDCFITGDVSSCLRSVKWIPLDTPSLGAAQTIHLGMYNTNITGNRIAPPTVVSKGPYTLNIPHPSNVMLRTSSTCEYNLYIPFIGNTSISADILADESTLNVYISYGATTGELVAEVKTGSGKIIGTYGGNVACDIPVGGSGISMRNMASSVVHGVMAAGAGIGAIGAEGAATTKALATASLANAKAGISDIRATNTTVGGVDSVATIGIDQRIMLTCSYWDVSTSGSNLTSMIGSPYYKTDTIGNHGFVKCSGASIDIAGYDDVIDTINSYMNNGIYIE